MKDFKSELKPILDIAGKNFHDCLEIHQELSEIENQVGLLETWFATGAEKTQKDFDIRAAHLEERISALQKNVQKGG